MRHAARIAAFTAGCCSLLALSACGSQEISVSKSDPYYKGAQIFDQRCSGCHSLDIVGAHGSATKAKDKEIADGPNFNQRRETEENVLYALRNGGFSGKIMPQNIVTGSEAVLVADFLAKYAGADAKNPAAPKREPVQSDAAIQAEEAVPTSDGGDATIPVDATTATTP